jgi:hypothetical protein
MLLEEIKEGLFLNSSKGYKCLIAFILFLVKVNIELLNPLMKIFLECLWCCSTGEIFISSGIVDDSFDSNNLDLLLIFEML